ncbi:NAD(P)-dependent oxidoreductase [Corynebacterium sp.]|uniref:NAD(P)-dependent oxidoreductase n=1 Tax=Corynebacterium sp. TaxID=1720 RepID=UPI0026DC4690|nr:NAD(P)H-binding protein [Corynebacterium sp.]MDO5076565.1 NAD(P)H-binding protein [Corynebacterium sp.]
MRIAVIGAAGLVGTEVVAEATRRGHDVTAYTRNGAAGTTALDVANTAGVVDAINDHDVTVISVASRDNYPAVVDAHKALINAAPTGRFIVVGGAGALEVNGTRLYELPDFPAEYLTEAKTFGAVLDAYRDHAAALQWSIAAPSPELAPGVRTGHYVTELNSPAGDYVSTQDFAVAIVDEAETNAHPGQRFTVASERA